MTQTLAHLLEKKKNLAAHGSEIKFSRLRIEGLHCSNYVKRCEEIWTGE